MLRQRAAARKATPSARSLGGVPAPAVVHVVPAADASARRAREVRVHRRERAREAIAVVVVGGARRRGGPECLAACGTAPLYARPPHPPCIARGTVKGRHAERLSDATVMKENSSLENS